MGGLSVGVFVVLFSILCKIDRYEDQRCIFRASIMTDEGAAVLRTKRIEDLVFGDKAECRFSVDGRYTPNLSGI